MVATTNAALASGGITNCCLRCGLRNVFFSVRPIGVAGAIDTVSSTNLLEQKQAPSGKACGAGERGQRESVLLPQRKSTIRAGGV